jgi:hypothetical protein
LNASASTEGVDELNRVASEVRVDVSASTEGLLDASALTEGAELNGAAPEMGVDVSASIEGAELNRVASETGVSKSGCGGASGVARYPPNGEGCPK